VERDLHLGEDEKKLFITMPDIRKQVVVSAVGGKKEILKRHIVSGVEFFVKQKKPFTPIFGGGRSSGKRKLGFYQAEKRSVKFLFRRGGNFRGGPSATGYTKCCGNPWPKENNTFPWLEGRLLPSGRGKKNIRSEEKEGRTGEGKDC